MLPCVLVLDANILIRAVLGSKVIFKTSAINTHNASIDLRMSVAGKYK